MKIAIVGSRTFENLQLVRDIVAALPANSIVVSGGAPGVDTVAVRAAEARGLVDGLCLRDILPEACQKLKGYQAVGWDMAHPIRQAAHFGTQFRTPQGDIVLGPDGWRALAPRGMAVRKDGRLVAFDAREAICPTREEAYRRLLAAKG